MDETFRVVTGFARIDSHCECTGCDTYECKNEGPCDRLSYGMRFTVYSFNRETGEVSWTSNIGHELALAYVDRFGLVPGQAGAFVSLAA